MDVKQAVVVSLFTPTFPVSHQPTLALAGECQPSHSPCSTCRQVCHTCLNVEMSRHRGWWRSQTHGAHSEHQHTQEEWEAIAGRALEEAVVVETLQNAMNIKSLKDSLSI